MQDLAGSYRVAVAVAVGLGSKLDRSRALEPEATRLEKPAGKLLASWLQCVAWPTGLQFAPLGRKFEAAAISGSIAGSLGSSPRTAADAGRRFFGHQPKVILKLAVIIIIT